MKKQAQPTGKYHKKQTAVSVTLLIGDMTQEMHLEAQELLANSESYKRIWKSREKNEWHWVVQFPNTNSHDYSGMAETKEKAEEDIVLSAIHYLFTHKPHIL